MHFPGIQYYFHPDRILGYTTLTMPRRISSLTTFYVKFLSPIFFVLWTIIFMKMLQGTGGGFGEMAFAVLFAVVIVGTAFWMSWGLKKVRLDDRNLYVSNYLKEITVPISEIGEVSEFILYEPRRVTIHLRNPTEFGQKIVFLAKYRYFAFLSPHPIVDELTQMAYRSSFES